MNETQTSIICSRCSDWSSLPALPSTHNYIYVCMYINKMRIMIPAPAHREIHEKEKRMKSESERLTFHAIVCTSYRKPIVYWIQVQSRVRFCCFSLSLLPSITNNLTTPCAVLCCIQQNSIHLCLIMCTPNNTMDQRQR